MDLMFRSAPARVKRINIYTIRQQWTKIAMNHGVVVIDARTQYGLPMLSMPVRLLQTMREGSKDIEWLMSAYMEFLEASYQENRGHWLGLFQSKHIAVADEHALTLESGSYNEYAHRPYLATFLACKAMAEGYEVSFGGEIHYNVKTKEVIML